MANAPNHSAGDCSIMNKCVIEESEKRMRREDEYKRKVVTGAMHQKYIMYRSQSVLEDYERVRIRAIERR